MVTVALLGIAGVVLLALVASLLPEDDRPEVAAPMVHVEVRQAADGRPYDWQGEQ
jgi:hypothetical protein